MEIIVEGGRASAAIGMLFCFFKIDF